MAVAGARCGSGRDSAATICRWGSIRAMRPSACCVTDDSGTECEDRTPDECAAQGGTPSATGTCSPDPCGVASQPASYYGSGGDDDGHGGSGGSGHSGHDG